MCTPKYFELTEDNDTLTLYTTDQNMGTVNTQKSSRAILESYSIEVSMHKFVTAAIPFAELKLSYQLFDSAFVGCVTETATDLMLNEPAAKRNSSMILIYRT